MTNQIEKNPDFVQRTFEYMGNGCFAMQLPDAIGEELIVELRASIGESAAVLFQWLAHASIAAEDLIPILAQRRLPGAAIRIILNAREIQRYSNHLSGLLFGIQNSSIQLEEKQIPLFAPDKKLIIQGHLKNMPASILLYATRDQHEGESQAG